MAGAVDITAAGTAVLLAPEALAQPGDGTKAGVVRVGTAMAAQQSHGEERQWGRSVIVSSVGQTGGLPACVLHRSRGGVYRGAPVVRVLKGTASPPPGRADD